MDLYSVPPLLTLCCFLGLAGIALFHGQRTPANHLFFIICLLGSFLNIDILIAFNVTSPATALRVSRIDHFFLVYLFPVYIHFFHEYLHIQDRKWLIYAAYVYAFILMCITPTPLYFESMRPHFFGLFPTPGPFYSFFGLGALFVTGYVLILIYESIRREQRSARRITLRYVFVGFGVMGVMNGLNVFPIYGYSIYPPGNLSFLPLICFGIGVLRYQILDMDILIKKGLIYTLLTALLTCLYALIILIASKMMKGFNLSDTIYFPILFFLLITIVFGPLKNRIQVLVDRLFAKGRYDYQKTLKQVSQRIASILNIDEIGIYLTDTIVNVMKVDTFGLFISDPSGTRFSNLATRGKHYDAIARESFGPDSLFIRHLEISGDPIIKKTLNKKSGSEVDGMLSEMDRLCAEVILPLIFKKKLNGFIILSEKLSGDLFSIEDLDLLETLSSQTALAIENARSYKEIEDLNQNLEAKVEERTESLQTALAEKEKTQEQLIRSESLAAIGQLVAGTAHELNNPLASVTSLIQSTIEDLVEWDGESVPDENLIDDLQFAGKELRRAKEIVASLLGLSRQTQRYSEAVNLNTVLEDALRVLKNQYKHQDLNIIEDYAEDLPDIQGNFANLGQVVINIIKNAIQAVSETSGTIFLTTRFDSNRQRVEFECRDTGPGIPAAIRSDIFKPFFTTKEVGKGTGLGLYICHEIIERHGGAITLEDTDKGSARFVVRLPLGQMPSPPFS